MVKTVVAYKIPYQDSIEICGGEKLYTCACGDYFYVVLGRYRSSGILTIDWPKLQCANKLYLGYPLGLFKVSKRLKNDVCDCETEFDPEFQPICNMLSSCLYQCHTEKQLTPTECTNVNNFLKNYAQIQSLQSSNSTVSIDSDEDTTDFSSSDETCIVYKISQPPVTDFNTVKWSVTENVPTTKQIDVVTLESDSSSFDTSDLDTSTTTEETHTFDSIDLDSTTTDFDTDDESTFDSIDWNTDEEDSLDDVSDMDDTLDDTLDDEDTTWMYPGDSLPKPNVTTQQLDNELDHIAHVNAEKRYEDTINQLDRQLKQLDEIIYEVSRLDATRDAELIDQIIKELETL